jgi:hypothetical protein
LREDKIYELKGCIPSKLILKKRKRKEKKKRKRKEIKKRKEKK